MVQPIQRSLMLAVAAGMPLMGLACASKSKAPATEPPVVQPADSIKSKPDKPETPTSRPASKPVVVPTTAESASTAPATERAVEARKRPPVAPVAANSALADRLSEVAQDALRDPSVSEGSWMIARSMLQAARRFNPDEPRYARDLIEAELHMGDTAAASKTLYDYRLLAPTIRRRRFGRSTCTSARCRPLTPRLTYLTRIVNESSIPKPVRSASAIRLYNLHLERAESQAADEALAKSLELNPLNLDVLRLKYASIATSQPAAEDAPIEVQRLRLLLEMLKANPVQPMVAEDIAAILASAGLVQPALGQYQLAFALYRATSQPPSQESAVDYAAQFFLNDDTKSADALAEQLLGVDSTNMEAWFLRLLLARADGDTSRLAQLRAQAGIALNNRLSDILKESGDTTATTQPVTVPPAAGASLGGAPPANDPLAAPAPPPTVSTQPVAWPDPAAVLQKVQAANRPELTGALSVAINDIAWFQIFFEQRGGAEVQPWIDAFKTLNPDQTEVVNRMEGWAFLSAGQNAEAQVKLSAVADRDPLAAAGLLQLESKSADENAKAGIKDRAKALLKDHPVSLLGATLYELLKKHGARVTESDVAKQLQTELDKAPRDALGMLDRPQDSYSIRLEPLRATQFYGEPVLVRVNIQNIGKMPITVGDDGVLRSDLWFDAQFRGAMRDSLSGIAYDRIVGPLVLDPGQGTSQVVKVNQGKLRATLENNPISSMQFMISVITNPSSGGEGGEVTPGPAGQRTTMVRITECAGMPIMNNNAPAKPDWHVGAR